jgi:imidazole glycerol phosphate synthase glutamine amidotransferase subunit
VKVTLIDYGAGNATSVERALARLGAETVRGRTAKDLAGADAVMLPGVGHYAALARALEKDGLREALVETLMRGVPFLGICLGLQALYEGSEEAPTLAGLSLLPGRVRTLPSSVKLPHMGWDQLDVKRESALLEGIGPGDYFYFAHSYAAPAVNGEAEAVATCTHGAEFVAVLEKQNVRAVQFHPEKSGAAGSRVLQNFLRLGA